ncbi:MAG: polyphenol oxidase family protein [Actinomycetota bacterium]
MIRPAGFRGAAFGRAAEGNGRDDATARTHIALALGISDRWASLQQIHGAVVHRVTSPGLAGDGDALITDVPDLPLVVATADCIPIVVEGDRSAAVIHAGWRGVAAGIIPASLDAMRTLGDTPKRAAIGPSIGPCCYEVGDEVIDAIGGYAATTTFSTQSVDLWSAAADQLVGLDVWRSNVCTFTEAEYWSYRRDATTHRQIAVAWVPQN